MSINYDILYFPLCYSGMVILFARIRLIFFCNSVFIEIKFKRRTLFSKFCFSNLVIC